MVFPALKISIKTTSKKIWYILLSWFVSCELFQKKCLCFNRFLAFKS